MKIFLNFILSEKSWAKWIPAAVSWANVLAESKVMQKELWQYAEIKQGNFDGFALSFMNKMVISQRAYI